MVGGQGAGGLGGPESRESGVALRDLDPVLEFCNNNYPQLSFS